MLRHWARFGSAGAQRVLNFYRGLTMRPADAGAPPRPLTPAEAFVRADADWNVICAAQTLCELASRAGFIY